MKRILNLVIALIICGNLFSQTPLSYRFRKPVAISSTSWRFLSVAPGVNAVISVISTKNANLDDIDDSTVFPYAWQPFIRFQNGQVSAADSGYVEFRISFQNNTNGSPSNQKALAMTLVDCDGNGANSFRELIKVSLPAKATLISGSSIIDWTTPEMVNLISGTNNYMNIDTSIYSAMAQINFTNVSSFTMRVGVVGKITGNSVRQSSFYFKPFSAFNQALPVSLMNFDSKLVNMNAELAWSTASEDNLNRFEICRSDDGTNYYTIGTIKAISNNNDMMNYSYTDFNVGNKDAFYRLKMIDNEGNYTLSSTSLLKLTASHEPVTISLYPNPTTDYVNVNLNTSEESGVKVEILDAYGKEVHCLVNPEISSGKSLMIDVKDLERGIYVINILNSDGSSTSSKFIKR